MIECDEIWGNADLRAMWTTIKWPEGVWMGEVCDDKNVSDVSDIEYVVNVVIEMDLGNVKSTC